MDEHFLIVGLDQALVCFIQPELRVPHRKFISALVAVLALNTLAAAAFAADSAVSFDPAQGDHRDYRVNMRMQFKADDEPAASASRWFTLQSVMRYRVDATDPLLQVNIEPRFMQAENNDEVLFSSAQPEAFEQSDIPSLMGAGFDLTLNRESGETRLQDNGRAALRALADQAEAPIDQFEQQLFAPALAQSVPARQGEQMTIDGLQNLPALRLTVTQVDSNSVTATFKRAKDSSAPAHAMDGTAYGTSARFTDIHGRVRIDRDSGWIDAMTLISEQALTKGDRTARMRSAMTMQAVDNPTTGALYDSLKQFKTNTLLAAMPGSELHLPDSADAVPEDQAFEASKQPLAHVDSNFHIDDEDGALVLTIRYHEDTNPGLDELRLDTLTLRDANGKRLDKNFVLEWIGPDFSEGNTAEVRLLPLGWQKDDLNDIAEVQATFTYQPIDAPADVALPLQDTPTQLDDGPAHARAVPIDGGWRVTLRGSYTQYYTPDHAAVFEGYSAVTSDHADSGVRPTDQTLLDHVDNTNVWRQQFELKGDIDAFDLVLLRPRANTTTATIKFTRRDPAR